MRRRAAVALAGFLTVVAPLAQAETHAAAGASGGLAAVDAQVDPAARVVRFDAGGRRGEVAIDLPGPLADAAAIEAHAVAIGEGKSVVHVRVPSRADGAVAWEALIAGQDPALIWSGVTGLARGQEGEHAGTALAIEPPFVVVGDLREDLGICGEKRTLLAPKALDPKTMTLRGASMQRLSGARREAAERVVASRHDGPMEAPLARLLVATGASTAIGAPSALTDGDPSTTWSEGRPGDGHGEFVAMRAAGDVPIPRLAVVIAPPAPSPRGAAPRAFYLATETRTIEVTLPEDAWTHPGVAYDIPLAEPLVTSCLTLVLDKAYARGEAPDVTLAELVAYSPFDAPGAGLDPVAKALGGGGARAESAAAVLGRAGDAGLAAAAKAYPGLDPAGRALAVDAAINAGTCEASAPLLVAALGDGEAEVARKGREKIERCGKAATGALTAAVNGEDPKARRSAAPLLASIAPREGLGPLAAAAGRGDRPTRQSVRAALAKAARSATREQVAALIADAAGGTDARLDRLRALDARLAEVAPQADLAVAALAGPDAPMRTRYLLAEPLSTLARAGDQAAAARLRGMIASDADPSVRAHAAESARGIGGLTATLAATLEKDDAPRAREGALRALTGAKGLPVAEVAARLASDDWTFVRAAAAAALAAAPADRKVDDALASALRDSSPAVRESAIVALTTHAATASRDAIRDRLVDPQEETDVRLAAARAASALCDREAQGPLTALARGGALPMASESEEQLGLAAVLALGQLHPSDLASRLAPLSAADARPESRAAAARALATPAACR